MTPRSRPDSARSTSACRSRAARGTLPDDQLLYLVAILRDTPQPPPAMSPWEWQGFRDTLVPHGVYPLMAYRLRAWPADCRPPGDVMAWLDRVILHAAARSMRAGRTVRNLTFRRCTGHRTYHHAFSLNLAGAQEGGGFTDILFDQCSALAAGSGMERWSCGFDIPDAGDVARMTVRDSEAVDCWQDGFHLDGSWNGHRQRAEAVLFERCRASWNGHRSGTKPAELYQSGYYVQSARLVDCTADHNRKAGFLCKNQEVGGLVLEHCRDTGSAYGLVVEYGGNRAKVEGFVSDGATRRALQMVGNNADVGITILSFAGTGRPVLLGITERLEFVDAPGHVEDLKRYRARGYRMVNNRIAIVTDHEADLIEVHPPSRGSVDLGGLSVERCPPRPAMG